LTYFDYFVDINIMEPPRPEVNNPESKLKLFKRKIVE